VVLARFDRQARRRDDAEARQQTRRQWCADYLLRCRGSRRYRQIGQDHGRAAPADPHYPDSAIVVPLDEWRADLFRLGVLDKDASNPREDFRRLKNGLIERGEIGEWEA